jgi:hypothetical protein
MPDDQISNIAIAPWQPRELSLPVNKSQMLGMSGEVPIPMEDTSQIVSPMRWTLTGRPYDGEINLLYAADQAALDILLTNAQQGWKRPIYFAVTVSPDGQLDLQNYFQLEGQAYRVVPIRHNESLGRVAPHITPERLKQFKFTGLNDPDVYFDENIRRMVDNYRNIFAHTAERLANDGQREEARALLDDFLQKVPFETIPGDERSFLFIAQAYQSAGDDARMVEIMKQAEELVLKRLSTARSNRDLDLAARYVQLIRYSYVDAGDFDAAAAFSGRLAEALKDSTYRQTPAQIRAEFMQNSEDTPQDTLGS